MAAKRGSREVENTLFIIAQKTLSFLSLDGSVVSVFLLSYAQMEKLEKKTGMKKPGHIPNVFSFPEPQGFPHPEVRGTLLGEVYLNKDLKGGFEELAYLLIHGILHLAGYSHDTKNDILKMESLEQKIYTHIFHSESLKNSKKCHHILLQD